MAVTLEDVMRELATVAGVLSDLDRRLSVVERTDQVAASTVPSGDGETDIGIPDVAVQVTDTVSTVAGLDDRLVAAEDAVLIAGRLADEAAELGAAAGEDGRAAAAIAEERADAALQAADDATTAAEAAVGAIPAIQAAAEAADLKATNAQTAASDAASAAASAAGLAASKGQVIVQVSAPTGTRADPANLWIDISLDSNGNPKNRPNRYNPDTAKWEPVTDQAAVDAAAAAAAAKTAADLAAAAATTAQASADGKTTTTYSAVAPSADGKKAGDTWFVRSASTGIVTGVFEWSGTAWVQRTLDNATIANLDAGKINAGYIAAARIAAQTITGDLIAASTIQAANIAADTLTSREIAADAITAAELAANAVIARNILAGTITTEKLAAAVITAEKIAAATITGDKLAANTVTAREILAGSITADLLSANAIDGKTITGAIVQSAATGKRVVLSNNRMNFYGLDGTTAVNAGVIEGLPNGAAGGLISIGPGTNVSHLQVGTQALPTAGSATVRVPGTGWFGGLFVEGGIDGSGGTTIARAFRAPVTNDASLTSTGHAFQIGTDDGANLIMDNNEIMTRVGGAATSLFINTDGGNVGLGNAASTITIPGTINNPFIAAHTAAGSTAYNSSISAGGNASVNVSFPSGRFSSAPVVTCSASNGRFNATPQNVTATGFTISLTNVTTASGTPGAVTWQASDAG